MRRTRTFASALALSLWVATCALAQGPAKKLIEFGWDVPRPSFVQQHIRQMETMPFDGLVMQFEKPLHAFYPAPLAEQGFEAEVAALNAIEWDKFTDNFLIVYASDDWEMDWFDDKRWQVARQNMTWLSDVIHRAGLKGICFDPETYTGEVFNYGRWKDRPFEVVEAKVRQRGREFMTALQRDNPELTILSLFGLSILYPIYGYEDRATRQEKLQEARFGLLPAFFNGLFDVAGPQVTLIDGNEGAYGFVEPGSFQETPGAIRRTVSLIDPSNHAKYAAQVKVGQALYLDYLLALDKDRPYLTHHFTPAERLLYLVHNLYWAMQTCDQYTWVYSERMDWWKGNLPEGTADVVRTAIQMVRNGEPLGYQMADYFRQAEDRQRRGIKYD